MKFTGGGCGELAEAIVNVVRSKILGVEILDQTNDLITLYTVLDREFTDFEVVMRKLFKDVPEGHPLKELLNENEGIVKESGNFMLYARTLLSSGDEGTAKEYVKTMSRKLLDVRTHYVKLQTLLYPYLERGSTQSSRGYSRLRRTAPS